MRSLRLQRGDGSRYRGRRLGLGSRPLPGLSGWPLPGLAGWLLCALRRRKQCNWGVRHRLMRPAGASTPGKGRIGPLGLQCGPSAHFVIVALVKHRRNSHLLGRTAFAGKRSLGTYDEIIKRYCSVPFTLGIGVAISRRPEGCLGDHDDVKSPIWT